MKLVIRSQYWGSILKGKPRVDASNPTRSFRTISGQAVLNIEGQYWGCCQGAGKRVLEMTERHFLDCHEGDWDLYLVATTPCESQAVHTFFLLPQTQTNIDVTYQTGYNGWQFFGTASANTIRQNLTDLLSDMFKPNETIGFRYHHVHVEIMMDQVIDYAIRAKKLKNKAEADGATQKTATTTDNTKAETEAADASSSQVSKPPIPPVVKSDSQDASSPLTCTSYNDVTKFGSSTSFDSDMVCYPVPVPYPMIPGAPMMHHVPMYHHNDPNYGYTMVPAGMPIPHVGLAPYMQVHPINGFFPPIHPTRSSEYYSGGFQQSPSM
jgi:hypothetical protein